MLKLDIGKDKMMAAIKDFKESWYNDDKYNFDQEWLKNELKRHKIRRIDDDFLKRAFEALRRSSNPNSLVVSQGDPGKAPEGATLVLYEEPEEQADEKEERNDEKVDLRKSTIKTTKVGQKIVEWQFGEPGVPGQNIYGDPIPPPPPELPEVNLGEGVTKKADGFYAKIEGLVDLNGLTLDVLKTYVKEGDVNLVTGDIEFDGSVLVEGDIASGAKVRCTEKLTVTGNITSSTAIAGKGVVVEGGIVNSTVKCEGNMEADFIENSTLTIQGNLRVARNIMNANVVVKQIFTNGGDPGLIVGGVIYASDGIVCESMGMESNATTRVFIGYDWKLSNRIGILEGRYKKSETIEAELGKQVSMMKNKTKAQREKTHDEDLKALEDKHKRVKKIQRYIKGKISGLNPSSMKFNEKAEIVVFQILNDNCDIRMGEARVKLVGNYESAKVEMKKKTGTHVHALPDDFKLPEAG